MKAELVNFCFSNFCLYICKNSELGIVLTATKGLALQKWTSISKNGIGEDYPYVELK